MKGTEHILDAATEKRKMRLKNKIRTVSAIPTTILGYVNYNLIQGTVQSLNHSDSYHTILLGGIALPITFILADYLFDIYRGTHHYFSLKVWSRLTRNPEKRKRMEKELEEMLQAVNSN